MKKLFVAIAMIMTTVIAMAQSQLYVIMKDGSGTSFPEATVDSLTFNDDNGATIYGLKDLANSIAQLRKDVDSLKNVIAVFNSITDTSVYHEYVDLGLPSGTLWATCNIGAKKPSEYGDLFAWGELFSKFYYSASNYSLDGKSMSDLRAENIIDAYMSLAPKYDAATYYWGEEWKMPTSKEMEELVEYCTTKWTDLNGTFGVLFTSTINEKSIFLPCAGYFNDKEHLVEGQFGYYLTSTFVPFDEACGTLFMVNEKVFYSQMKKSHGRSVRPVKKKKIDPTYTDDDTHISGHNFVDLGLPSGRLWANDDMAGVINSKEYGLFRWAECHEAYGDNLDNNYLWHNLNKVEVLKDAKIINDNMTISSGHDVASYSWGIKWRIPTKEDYEELFKNCEITFEEKGKSMKLIGPNGNSIKFENLELGRWTSTLYTEPDANSAVWAWSLDLRQNTDGEWIAPSKENNYSIYEDRRLMPKRIRPISDMIKK